MNTRLSLVLIASAASLTLGAASGHAVERSRSSDVHAIQQTEQDFVDAWQRDDAQAMAATFASDADLINPRGDRARGRAGIQQLLAREHAAGAPLSLTRMDTRCGDPRFLAPDVAVVTCDFTVEGVHVAMGAPSQSARGEPYDVASGRRLDLPSERDVDVPTRDLDVPSGRSLERQNVAGGGASAAGGATSTMHGVLTEVLVRQGGRWLFAVGRPMIPSGPLLSNAPSSTTPSSPSSPSSPSVP